VRRLKALLFMALQHDNADARFWWPWVTSEGHSGDLLTVLIFVRSLRAIC